MRFLNPRSTREADCRSSDKCPKQQATLIPSWTWQTTESVLAAANIELATVDSLVMVGGSSQMQACRAMLQEKLETTVKSGLNPDEVVALGAAAYAASLADEVSGQSGRRGDPISATFVP